ncbi:MAG: T9SS type A sorting domain-containing protein, partial [bacterium]
PSTTIRFDVAKSAHVEMILYDVLGRQVVVLVNKRFEAGHYQVIFNAVNLSSGVYFYSIKIGEYYRTVKKMLILK